MHGPAPWVAQGEITPQANLTAIVMEVDGGAVLFVDAEIAAPAGARGRHDGRGRDIHDTHAFQAVAVLVWPADPRGGPRTRRDVRASVRYPELLVHHPHNHNSRSSPTGKMEQYMINGAMACIRPKQPDSDWTRRLFDRTG